MSGAESWRFGDRVFEWRPASSGRAARPVLVTQVGRSFQAEHPDVPVLFDHGRHIVVEAPSADTWQPGPPGETLAMRDWRMDVLPADGLVLQRARPSARAVDPLTARLLATLSADEFLADLTRLAGFGTRHSLSDGFGAAASWVADRLDGLGFDVTQPAITVGPGTSRNVIGDRPGDGLGDRGIVLLTAHLDSINIAGGPSAPAPGADDNGSGSAGVLQMAAALAGEAWRHDLRVILFGGEEEGLFGSQQYVDSLADDERARIRAVLNLDMVGRLNTEAPAVLLEGAPRSAVMINQLATAAASVTSLAVETSLNPFASDHVPFLDAGIPAVLSIEGADSANGDIHSDRDVVATVTPEFALQILRMDLAALVGWLEPATAVPRAAGQAVGGGQNSRAEGSSVPLRTA